MEASVFSGSLDRETSEDKNIASIVMIPHPQLRLESHKGLEAYQSLQSLQGFEGPEYVEGFFDGIEGLNESKIMEVIKVLCVLRVFKVLKVTRVLKVVGPEGLRNQGIPDICHEPHEYIRVNFFWPV